MNKILFYNNLVFRISAPPVFGMVIYLLILMFFDSVEMLASNFFSREVLFVIGLTFVFFELNRLIIVLLNSITGDPFRIVTRIIVQYLASFLFTTAVISLALYLYFIHIEGFGTIKSELVTFNSIYLFTAVFYHLYYFSMYFLHKKNDELVRSEMNSRNKLELELAAYKSQVNPEFLFQALEIIIVALHRNKKQADDLIDKLARVYRHSLTGEKNELAGITEEFEALEPVVELFKSKYRDALIVQYEPRQDDGYSLVPGTLRVLFEHAVINSLIDPDMPLTFKIESVNDHLLISYCLNETISHEIKHNLKIEHLKKSYHYLTGREFGTFTEERKQFFKIPLIKVEEE